MKYIKLSSKVNLIIHLIVKIKRDDVFALASQLAYYLILSFFPFMLFLMTLAGFSSISSKQILGQLNVMLPRSVLELTQSTVVEIFDNQYTGLLGISILLTLWTASSAFKAIIKSINKAYNFKEERSFIKLSIISMLGILALAVTIILALTALVFGNVIGDYIKSINPFYEIVLIIWNIFRYTFILAIMISIFICVYKFAPAKKLVWKEVIAGSIFSTVGWVLVSFVFSFYIDNFNNYSRFYGSLGAVFILMTWLFLISIIFILGVEINFVTSELRGRNGMIRNR
ncbi:YihY/virulence factor BrkB family protein [Clostridium sp. 2-1]|uniref:YihY/virulence factor BrkB family protein n=1 Tax=Clostridium TaxID=1485 RepID=UPI00042357C6|nr:MULTISPECIES: YihY/virulence factor BrkB family protein [Clostridium]MBN7574486.1 YihY/virulence factor BrkB family protein [Clostridium beijerinckii]MBN7579919.1 YihY/virulence factor BrkB family protein [Clostridium beijerinckii]MBN7584337.1 YihY/virulence factor BrkB family protein [Clostridium beijerinckii]MBO0520219.1 YihY/virulence factor BrkB family protein [Clostridium beijerinckii]POO92288.1 YihY/virulence factor BrkB family protein [Clostridium sp. 2-1]